MRTRDDTLTPDLLLCERCGYRIGGLDPSGACPECGTPIAQSVPERRTGLAMPCGALWPRLYWLVTEPWQMLTNPARAFSNCRFETGPNKTRLASHLAIAAFLMGSVAPFAAALSPNTDPFSILVATLAIPLFVFTWVPVFIVLRLLVFTEERGIRFFSSRRRFRVTKDVALAICAHAAPGWIFGGLLVVAGVLLGSWLQYTATHRSTGPLHLYLLAAPVGLPVAGFFVGMFWFETLVWVGVRKCRFANTGEARSEWVPPEPPGSERTSEAGTGANPPAEAVGSSEGV